MTAVEFLLRQFALLGYDMHQYETIIKEAKEMEKQQIIKSNRDGGDMVINKKKIISSEEYYNETFNNNNNETRKRSWVL